MATQTIRINLGRLSGTFTADVYLDNSNTTFATAAALSAETQPGFYTFTLSSSAGLYSIIVKESGSRIGSWYVQTTDTAATFPAMDTREGAVIKAKTDQLVFTVANQVDANALTGGGGSGGGTGARLVTVTVNDGAAALENAIVRMTLGAETYSLSTNVSGVAVFSLDDGTWTVTATKPGYTLTPTTIVVNGTETATYSMTAVSVTPSNPAQTTGTITVYTAGHVAVSGAVVDVEILRLENGTTGSGISDPLVSDTTNGSGYAEFTGLPRLASYRVRINDGKWFRGVTLDAAETPLVGSLGPAVDD